MHCSLIEWLIDSQAYKQGYEPTNDCLIQVPFSTNHLANKKVRLNKKYVNLLCYWRLYCLQV